MPADWIHEGCRSLGMALAVASGHDETTSRQLLALPQIDSLFDRVSVRRTIEPSRDADERVGDRNSPPESCNND